jgi:hypothetical protein
MGGSLAAGACYLAWPEREPGCDREKGAGCDFLLIIKLELDRLIKRQTWHYNICNAKRWSKYIQHRYSPITQHDVAWTNDKKKPHRTIATKPADCTRREHAGHA